MNVPVGSRERLEEAETPMSLSPYYYALLLAHLVLSGSWLTNAHDLTLRHVDIPRTIWLDRLMPLVPPCSDHGAIFMAGLNVGAR